MVDMPKPYRKVCMWQDLYVNKKWLLINNSWHLSYEFR